MDYLIKNKIEFDYIDISSSSKNNNLMWKTLRDHGIRLNRVSTPVILVDGNLHHSFKDLRQFLKTLDNKKFKAK
jgi:glutaredoxin-related protein